MLNITEEAILFIKETIEQATDKTMMPTLMSAGAGCGTPVIKLEMQPPLEGDIPKKISGIDIHIRPNIIKFLDDAELTVEDTFWGKKLKVKTVNGCS